MNVEGYFSLRNSSTRTCTRRVSAANLKQITFQYFNKLQDAILGFINKISALQTHCVRRDRWMSTILVACFQL